MADFQSPSHFHQFMQQVNMGARPSAELYMKRGCSYTVLSSSSTSSSTSSSSSVSSGGGGGGGGVDELHIHRPDLKGNLREKLSQLRHTRMSRQTAVNRLKKAGNAGDKNDKNDNTDDNIVKILDLYQSLTKNGFNVLHPDEAVSNLDKYEPVVEQLTRTYDPKHPLTAYYGMLTGLVRAGKAVRAEKAGKAGKTVKTGKLEKNENVESEDSKQE
jgi:hypothetical protein